MSSKLKARGNRDDAFWMPFTPLRQYRQDPITFVSADGVHYTTRDGRRIFDGMAGLWCVNAGHNQPAITEAIRDMAGRLDFVSSFKMSHPAADVMANELTALTPTSLDHAFFVNSGSEAVDTALKIARAYHHIRGEGRRIKLIGRAKGYHGMGFGGLSVAGIGHHKRDFGPLLPDVAHLPLPYDASMAFSKGQPLHGAKYASALEQLLSINDPLTVAAVIVEPVTGSGGVYPPPVGYLNVLREICDKHGILLIFDEVITGFGRLGRTFAAEALGVTPDLLTSAKGLTNGTVPMGAVIVRDFIFDAFMSGPPEAIELLHGYTYSAHPLACAAGLATISLHQSLDINSHVQRIIPLWEKAALAMRDAPHVVDCRTAGILCGIELAPRHGAPGIRGNECMRRCYDEGVLIRNSGDTLVLSPPLILEENDIVNLFATIRGALVDIA